jgi:hypothetical protein
VADCGRMLHATRRQRRTQQVLALGALAPAALLVLAAVLGAVLPGRIDRATLEATVGSRVSDATQGSGYNASCHPSTGGTWRCVLTTTDLSDTGVTYQVALTDNCWSGTLVRTGGMVGLSRRSSDCIQLLDQLTG